MQYSYKTKGVCSRRIDLEVEDGIIRDLKFYGGCNGNLQGISAICRGKKATEVIDVFKGIKCGNKSSSCPEQLACALEEIINQ